MALRTFVKVSGIMNLSDARYCAGMGVDLLGFAAIKGEPSFIDAAQFQQVRGWVTGPQIVAEVYGLKDQSELQGVLDNYKPDYLEMGVKELSLFASLPLPVIIALDTEQELRLLTIEPAYLISRILINASIPVLVKVESRAAAQQMLDDNRLKGIVLQGGSEVRPGLKNYELMNEVLELLEAED